MQSTGPLANPAVAEQDWQLEADVALLQDVQVPEETKFWAAFEQAHEMIWPVKKLVLKVKPVLQANLTRSKLGINEPWMQK